MSVSWVLSKAKWRYGGLWGGVGYSSTHSWPWH